METSIMITEHTTACPRNCYSTCSLKVFIEDGRIKGIEPHPENRATREGVCLKGESYPERVYSEDRIYYPLKRGKNKKKFTRISWDDAFETISGNLRKFKDDYGPQSVLFLNGSGTKGILNEVSTNFWRLYGGYTGTYGDLCWPSGLEATRLTLGDNKNSAPWDIANARLILMWGKNPAETNIHQLNFIHAAQENGAKLIVIDPRRTPTADRADLLIQVRPGTDGALALGVANLLIANNQINREFIEKHVLGFNEFEKIVKDYSVEKVSEITDVPKDSIIELANYIGTISPLTICAGFGMQRYSNSGQTIRTLLALLAITGNIGKKGAGWVYANLSTHVFQKVKDPLGLFPPQKHNNAARISVSVARLGRDILDQKEPPIKMIWVERGNPVLQAPETPLVLEAFRKADFRVVIDQFMTDTAKEADIVLPAKSMFEQTDVINAYWHDYIQLKQKILEPPKEVKPETEIYRMLAQKLDFSVEDVKRNIPGPGEDEILAYLEKRLAAFPELSIDILKKGPVLSPCFEEIAWENLEFSTPSKKIEILSEEAKERWNVDLLPNYCEPVESVIKKEREEYPLNLLTPNVKNSIHSQFLNLKVIRDVEPEPWAVVHPQDAESRGIKEDDEIRIFNDRGEVTIKAKFDFSIKPGCIVVPNGWWHGDGAAVNLLTKGRETDMAHGAAFHDTTVQIAKKRKDV